MMDRWEGRVLEMEKENTTLIVVEVLVMMVDG